MPGISTSGNPSTDDFNLGRGIVYASALDANDLPVGFRDLGNATAFSTEVTTEYLEHRSMRSGLTDVDRRVLTSRDTNVSFTLDEYTNFDNLALFLMGDAVAYTNPCVAGFTSAELVAPGGVTSSSKGKWFDLFNPNVDSNARIYDVKTANLTLTSTNATPVTLVDGTDYVLDAEIGRVQLLDSSEIGDIISDGEGIDIAYTADTTAKGVDEVRGLTQDSIRVAIKFIGVNPANNDQKIEHHFHVVEINPDGATEMISDDWTTFGFSGKAIASSHVDANAPVVRSRLVVPA